MQTENEPAAITFQPMHQGQVPQRVLPVHHCAQNFPRKRLQLCVGTVLERHLAYVAADVELWVVFPSRKANIKERGHHALEVAGNQRQLRLDELDESLERDLASNTQTQATLRGMPSRSRCRKTVSPQERRSSCCRLCIADLLVSCRSSVIETIAHLSSRKKIATSASPA